MEFDAYLADAWNKQAENANLVAMELKNGFTLLKEPANVVQLANLATHVYGEHLGQYEKAEELICQLQSHELAGDTQQPELLLCRAIISAGLKNISAASEYFDKAVLLAADISQSDPANRSMAVGANNLAATLQEKPELTDAEKNLMLKAAVQARKFWAIAGTWLQVERAEYRLSECYLKAGDILNSIKHANQCLTMCQENQAPALEMFFAYKAIASVESAMKQNLRSLPQMEKYFELLSGEDQAWCKAELARFKSAK